MLLVLTCPITSCDLGHRILSVSSDARSRSWRRESGAGGGSGWAASYCCARSVVCRRLVFCVIRLINFRVPSHLITPPPNRGFICPQMRTSEVPTFRGQPAATAFRSSLNRTPQGAERTANNWLVISITVPSLKWKSLRSKQLREAALEYFRSGVKTRPRLWRAELTPHVGGA